jgi:branched-chain amino acid aminotransferase
VQAWVNGHIVTDPDAPAVAVTDRGFTLGAGVFETLKVLDGNPFALTRHLARLAHGAEVLGIGSPDPALVRRGVAEVLAAEPHQQGRLRITWTGTTLAITSTAFASYSPTTAIVTSPWPRNERSPLAGIKATAFAENTLSTAYAAQHDAGEAVLANLKGDLCEGAGSNIFYVLDGELRTPTLASGCLPGVTRALVLEWFGAREVDAPLGVLNEAEEIFLVSSTRNVQGVDAVDGRPRPAPGPVTASVARLWAEREAQSLDP